ncbi:MAG: T9SS type A sorting domain-containing protein [Bacteroidales bacterium]
MKNKFILIIHLSLLCFFILVYKPLQAQQLPPDSTEWSINELLSPESEYSKVTSRANLFFSNHPELDTLQPILKKSYYNWKSYWENRSVFIKGDTILTKIGDITSELNNVDYSIYPAVSKKWILITPDQDDFQDLGVVSCIWNSTCDPNYILAGTESSGLWKSINGGSNWINITDTYDGNNANPAGAFNHYPFGVTSIAVNHENPNIILIAATIPFGFNGINSNGFGILKSIDGGNTWSKTNLFPIANPIGQVPYNLGLDYGITKIIFDPIDPNGCVFAIGGPYLYKSQDLFNSYVRYRPFTISPIIDDNFNKYLKFRDIEILNIPVTSSTLDRSIFLSTDSYNKSISAQLIIGKLPSFDMDIEWSNNTNILSHNGFKEVIAIEREHTVDYDLCKLSYLDLQNNDPININDHIYVAYQVLEIDPSNTSLGIKFCVDNIARTTSNPHTFHCLSTKYLYHDDGYYSPCSEFGYFYDSFEWYEKDMQFIVGGNYITKLNSVNPGSSSVFSPTTYNCLTPYSSGSLPNDEWHWKNRSIHLGVRRTFTSLALNYTVGSPKFYTFVGTDGGISLIRHGGSGGTDDIKNINGKGLAIQQFNDITSSQNNAENIIVGGVMHNGYWGLNNQNPSWLNTWFDDGGKVLLNDNQTNFIYYVTYSTLGYGLPANQIWQGGSFFRSDQGYKLETGGSPVQFPYFDWVAAQIIPTNPFASIPPIIIDKNSSTTLYLGGHDIHKSIDNGSSWAAITSFPLDYHSYALKVIAQSQSNPSVLYASFENPTWCVDNNGNENSQGPTPPPGTNYYNNALCHLTNTHKLYKYNGSSWSDISLNVGCSNALSWSAITDILINPNIESELWTTHSGAWKDNGQAINRVLHSVNGGDSWVDYSTGLTCLSVNCIRYIKDIFDSTYYMLIVGTDAGVFVRGKDDSQWTPYRDGMPLAIVTDIEIWDNGRKIRAATFGRGIWEAEIPCMPAGSQYSNINSNLIWNTEHYSSGIHIYAPNTLTITSKVRFRPNAIVTVDEGAKLIVNGGVLEACPGEMWEGIRILGSLEIDPDDFYESAHAIVQIINNGTIKDAIIGIKDFGGGVIYSDYANFINNQIAVQMNEYTYRPEKSYFQNSNFITNDMFSRPLNYPFQHFVELNGVYKLNILGCKFENKIPVGANLNWTLNGMGIKSYNSVYNVCDRCNSPTPLSANTPCPQEYLSDSKFTNLDYGINAIASNTTFNFSVKNTEFDNNYRGIFALGTYHSSFTLNKFKVPYVPLEPYTTVSYIGAYGLFLMNCSDYTVESNIFDKSDDYPWASLGLLIHNSGSAFNTVYNNEFHNIKYAATLCQDINGSTDRNIGLKIKCNDYRNCNHDISVVDYTINGNGGISAMQGALALPGQYNKDQKPAGNTFSQTGSISDIDNTNSHNIDYYYHDGTNENWVPKYYTTANVFPIKDQFSIYSKLLSCPSIAATNPNSRVLPELSILYQGLAENTSAYNSSKLILKIWLDGGNTEVLLQTIELTYPWEAYELFQSLIVASPYLSEDVLIEAIASEDVLPAEMLKLVLLANPQSIRSDRVMEALAGRINPFPTDWIDEILAADAIISPVEDLQADVSYYAAMRKYYLDLLKQYYLADTNSNAIDSLQNLLSGETDLDSRFELVFINLAMGNIEKVYEDLDIIRSLVQIEDEEGIQIYDYLEQIIPLIYQLDHEGSNWDEIEDSIIIDLSENNNNLAGALAKALRLHYDSTYTLQEPIYTNTTQTEYTKPPHAQHNIKQADKNKFSITPNPASDYIVIKYNTDQTINDALLIIYDIQGKLILQQKLNNKSNQDIVDIKSLTNAYYHCKLLINGKQQFVEKLIIKH